MSDYNDDMHTLNVISDGNTHDTTIALDGKPLNHVVAISLTLDGRDPSLCTATILLECRADFTMTELALTSTPLPAVVHA